MKRMRRLVRWTTRLYPQRWRERYGAELDALLEDVDLQWRDIASVVRLAVATRLTSPEPAARSSGSRSVREGKMKVRRIAVGVTLVIAIMIAYVTSGGLPVLVDGFGPDGQGSFLILKPVWVDWLTAYRLGDRSRDLERLATLYTRAACQGALSPSFRGDQHTWPLNPPVAHNGSQHVLTAEVNRVVVDEVNSLARMYDVRVRCVVVGSGKDFWDYRVDSVSRRTSSHASRTTVFKP